MQCVEPGAVKERMPSVACVAILKQRRSMLPRTMRHLRQPALLRRRCYQNVVYLGKQVQYAD